MRRYKYNKDYFEKIDTATKAYWLGFLYADGSITRFYKNKEKTIIRSLSIEISLQLQDAYLLQEFIDDLEGNLPIQSRKHNNKQTKKTYYSKRLVVNNTKLARDLIELGCTPSKTFDLTFPNKNQVPTDFIHDFIRGYFDGDGGVYNYVHEVYHKNRKKTYMQNTRQAKVLGTKGLLMGIKEVCESNGLKVSSLQKKTESGIYEITFYGHENLIKLHDFLGYKNATRKMLRKEKVFQELEEAFHSKNA